jgi:hypothetical protein
MANVSDLQTDSAHPLPRGHWWMCAGSAQHDASELPSQILTSLDSCTVLEHFWAHWWCRAFTKGQQIPLTGEL